MNDIAEDCLEHAVLVGEMNPASGPAILFFSGGSALNDISRELKRFTHNSIHLVTVFDSGGSSAEIRRVFGMPAVGDVRNRMVALIDESQAGAPELIDILNERLFAGEAGGVPPSIGFLLKREDPRLHLMAISQREALVGLLDHAIHSLPPDFNFEGACIGNLILAGAYLECDRNLAIACAKVSEIIKVQGIVRPITNDNAHLAADLVDGSIVVGQHHLTGKEVAPLGAPLARLRFSRELDSVVETRPMLSPESECLIADADLICYPPGSFYTSLIANLMVGGVAEAIAANPCPKVFLPSLGEDPEQVGLPMVDAIKRILQVLKAASGPAAASPLDWVLLDRDSASNQKPISSETATVGFKLRFEPKLISELSAPYYDAQRVVILFQQVLNSSAYQH